MPSIYELRKFLVSERFVILKGDYVGHEFHGNQYTTTTAGEHAKLANSEGELVSRLKSEGRRRNSGRGHGYSLDGDLAKAAMDAIDHKVASQKKGANIKAEVEDLRQKVIAAGMTPGDWPGYQNDPTKKDLLVQFNNKVREEEIVQEPNIGAGWRSRSDHTVQSLSKDAVTALNRGYKELIVGMITPPKAKSLFDKNNQPRPEALAVVVKDVKRISNDYKTAEKTAQDENADPTERYSALVSWSAMAKNAEKANNFLTQVYRMANDSTNELAAEKNAQKSGSSAATALEYFRTNGLGVASKASEVYLNRAKEIVDPATFDPTTEKASQEITDARQQAVLSLRAIATVVNGLPYGDPSRSAAQSVAEKVRAEGKIYSALSEDVAVNQAKESLKTLMPKVGTGSLDKIVTDSDLSVRQPENFINASKAYGAYTNLVRKTSDATSVWEEAQALKNALGEDSSLAQKKLDEYKANAPEVQEIGRKIADAHLAIGHQMMDYIRENADSNDPETIAKANDYLSYVNKCSGVGTSVYGKQTSGYAGSTRLAIPGFEGKFNEAAKLGTESSVFSDLITGKNKALVAIENAKTLPEVDTKDINKTDPNSYMYRSENIMYDLNNAKQYFSRARQAVASSPLSDADKKSISDSIDKTAGQTEATLNALTSNYDEKVLASALKNGDAEAASAKDPNSDNPMYAWHNAFEQYKIAYEAITKQIQSAPLSQSLNAQGHLRLEVKAKMDEAQVKNNAYQRERQYAL